MERRAALHLDRLARVMGEDEHRSMERRVRTPPALPLRVLVPSGVAELQCPHNLGADPRRVQPREGIVDASDAADRKSTRLNSSHRCISYAVFCLKKKK